MNKNKLGFLSLLFIGLICIFDVQCAQRFKDQEMMKSHHNHVNLKKQGDPQIIVHLIPHSHDDVGWLKTVDDYYYGGDMQTQFAGVQYTIDSVVQELSNNIAYKFSIVEVAFLYRWWNQANQTQRNKMKQLYKNGQIEFLNGGWCMSDQATPYYEDVIDQMTIGHKWLKETFGAIPTNAWHIDPFGHQASSASMFSRMGMQGFFFSRIDYQDKAKRLENKQMEMIWRPPQYNSEPSTQIFTHVNYYHYSPPPGFCFDIRCTDEPIKDDPTLQDYNLDVKAQKLVDYFKSMALHYKSNNLMHTLGQDFHFVNGNMWFKNYDKLLKYINERSNQFGMTMKYSTPSDYIDAIQKQANSYPIKSDDFFPYADVLHGYWTGYFTSRTGVKGFVREFGRDIQAVRKHLAELKMSNTSSYISNNPQKIEEMLWNLQMSQGILQHHDGVSGTQKQKVANDYINTALRSIKLAKSIYSNVKAEQISKQIGQEINKDSIMFNLFWNQTANDTGIKAMLQQNQTVLVNLLNPGAKETYEIKINIPAFDIKIIGLSNQLVQGDVVCVMNQQDCQLIFNLEFEESSNNYVKIMRSDKATASAKIIDLIEFRIIDKPKDFQISPNVSLTLTRTTQQFDLKINGQTEIFFIGYKYYESYQDQGQKGGAYIFRPANDTSKVFSTIKKVYYIDGTQNLVIVLEGTSTLTKVFFSKKARYIERWGIGVQSWLDSIPIDDNIGKQVCLSIKTTYDNNQQFYTDSNGLQEQYRKINYRPTWNLQVHEAVSGNYYPINSHIRIKDSQSGKNLTILTDRSVGGSVINKGEIELLVQRRLLKDDARGVGEPLNEVEIVNDKVVGIRQWIRNYIVFGNNYREVQKVNDQKTVLVFVQTKTGQFSKTQLRTPLIKVPQSVKLYLRPNTDGSYLMRLHNMNAQASAIVNIPDGWAVKQLTLNANQLWSDWTKKKYKWNAESLNESEIIDIEEVSLDQKLSILGKFFKKQSIAAPTQINLRPFDLVAYQLVKT